MNKVDYDFGWQQGWTCESRDRNNPSLNAFEKPSTQDSPM